MASTFSTKAMLEEGPLKRYHPDTVTVYWGLNYAMFESRQVELFSVFFVVLIVFATLLCYILFLLVLLLGGVVWFVPDSRAGMKQMLTENRLNPMNKMSNIENQ